MGKLFCFSVFGRKVKANKAKLDKETAQQSKDMGDPCGVVDMAALKKSPLLVDSLDNYLSCSEITGSKDASIEQRHRADTKWQTTAVSVDSSSPSPDPQLDSHLVRNVSTELVALRDTCESLNDLSSWSLHSQKTCLDAASVSVNEGASKSGDESQGLFAQHIAKLGPDSLGECADVSEDSSESLESESNPPPPEDFIRPSGESTSLNACPEEYFRSGNQCMPGVGPYSEDGFQHLSDVRAAGYEVDVVTGGAGFLYSPDTAVFPSSKSDGTVLDDEILTGHISDPGVYDREERQSMFESSLPLTDRTIAPLDTNVSTFMRKSESDSYICKYLPSEDTVENLSAEIGEHGGSHTELTLCSADKVMLKPESSNKVLDFNKRSSWWKIFMVSHRNIHLERLKQASYAVALGEGIHERSSHPMTGYTSDICEAGRSSEYNDVIKDALITNQRVHLERVVSDGKLSEYGQELEVSTVDLGVQAASGTSLWRSKEWIALPTAGSGLSRVEEWVRNIQQPDAPTEEEIPSENKELFNEIRIEEVGDASSAMRKIVGAVSMDTELANAAIRSLNPFSTVAHIAGIGLREVPSLGMFCSLKTLNLSANCIARISAGCLPRSLHVLDLSRNRIGVIEGFRELARLRVLNLSYNRISRIGHGLANCTLIKELYLAGNKIAEAEGLHRLLKLSILDLSFNKLTTSKALGQLAANYSSLLALNLLGNPVHMNIGEEQLRKLVLSITPHVTYLNKQPIKAVPAREAVVDSVARAALGTSQRNSKSSSTRASRMVAEARSTHQQNKLYSHRSKDAEKRRGSLFSESDTSKSARLPRQHHHHRHHNDGHHAEKGVGKDHRHSGRAPVAVHEHLLRKLAIDTERQGMHRSRSESALQDQV